MHMTKKQKVIYHQINNVIEDVNSNEEIINAQNVIASADKYLSEEMVQQLLIKLDEKCNEKRLQNLGI